MGVANSSQDEANHPYCCFLWKRCAFCGGDEEAQIVFCQHERDHLNPADCFHLLCYLYHCPCVLCREEKESNILGWDATCRSSSVFNSQQGSAATGVKLKEGRKVPPLLDHHHLHLHLHLLHDHLVHISHYLHTGRLKPLWIELNSYQCDLVFSSMMYVFD